jgi:hypothetical protein
VVRSAPARSTEVMTEEQPFLAGPRLSTIAGLRKAGVLQSFHFDPLVGLVGVRYTPAYERILGSGMIQFADPAFLGAVMIDDPVALRIWVEATAARLVGDSGGSRATRQEGPRGRKPSR